MKKTINQLVYYGYLFTIGCFLGYIFECTHYVIKYHYFVNKQGLIYGPFKPIYGLGFILFTIIFKPLKEKSKIFKFTIGFVIGAIYEYICSLFQEYVFGTYTWSYTSFNLSLNGRIYLPYCIVWGILALLWVDYGLRLFDKLINKISQKVYKAFGILLCIFMFSNFILTGLILHRMGKRANNIEASNVLDRFLDKYYPDEYVNKHMPKVRIIKKN